MKLIDALTFRWDFRLSGDFSQGKVERAFSKVGHKRSIVEVAGRDFSVQRSNGKLVWRRYPWRNHLLNPITTAWVDDATGAQSDLRGLSRLGGYAYFFLFLPFVLLLPALISSFHSSWVEPERIDFTTISRDFALFMFVVIFFVFLRRLARSRVRDDREALVDFIVG